MGCCHAKTQESTPLFNNPNNKNEFKIALNAIPVDKASKISTKASYRGSKLITSIDQFLLSSTDLISEKCGNINEIYNLLTPPLGKGTFGEVRKAIHKKSGAIRAVKLILKCSTTEEDKQRLLNEVDILKTLDHPNIIKIYEFFQDDKYFYIVNELCTGGELFDKILEMKTFNENTASDIMMQLLSAVSYCHTKKIVHRDIKPENLLLESKKEKAPIKVIDFGTSRTFNPNIKMNQKFGTILYMAPEVLVGKYNEKCDLWSCGVICYILLCGYPPINSKNEKELIDKIKEGNYEFDPMEWDSISDLAKDFVKSLLEKDPEKRVNAQQALNHPWILARRKTQTIDMNSTLKALNNLKTYRADRKLQQATWVFVVSLLATKEEKQELMNTFKILDLNGDGKLSTDELVIGYSKLMPKEEAIKEVDHIMKIVDTNNSGEIDYSEFVTASINRQKLLSKEKLEIVFKMFDKDGSGSISVEELNQVFSNGELEVTKEVWTELVKEVDENGDGEISYSEFKNMMEKLTGEQMA